MSITSPVNDISQKEKVIYNSTLRFSPDSAPFEINSDQFVSIILDTGGESINTVGTYVNYNPKEIEIRYIDTSTSACDYIIEKEVDNIEGKVKYSCSIVHDIDNSNSVVLAKLLIHPKTEGRSSLKFDVSSSVKGNDGLATEVLRRTTDASYLFLDDVDSLIEDKKNLDGRVFVYSKSHPNPERWYTKLSMRMLWSGENGTTNRYSLTKGKPGDLKDNYATTKEKMMKIAIPTDGLYYFNITEEKVDRLGPITSFPIHIDNTPPEKVILSASQNDIYTGDIVRFTVTAEDSGSGVASGYYIKVDDHILYPTKGVTYIQFPEKGLYSVTARVFDKANNFTEVSKIINVK